MCERKQKILSYFGAKGLIFQNIRLFRFTWELIQTTCGQCIFASRNESTPHRRFRHITGLRKGERSCLSKFTGKSSSREFVGGLLGRAVKVRGGGMTSANGEHHYEFIWEPSKTGPRVFEVQDV